jgi:hypothetical protein
VITYPDSDDALDRAFGAAAGAAPLRQTVTLERPWLAQPDALTLEPTYHLDGHRRLMAQLGDHAVALDEPVRLCPAYIAKPWGQEIWFTGIEARGESGIATNAGELPLSQYLALAPRRLTRRAPLVLLKVLDPKPEPVMGDLYFEVHEAKQEVYVVTHVDRRAWPDGRGRIRFGMDPSRRRAYGDDARFRHDYLAAVRAYEQVRRAIDGGQKVPAEHERTLREAMEAFTVLRELDIGDVVVVPTWLPHSLQHGVRVIEFQTPTYERYIISFAQRVLTQDHWDSAAAVARMRLEPPTLPTFEELAPGVERIVAFDDFRVWRVTLAAGADYQLPAHPSYLLCMAVRGEVQLGPLSLNAEQAAFVPAAALTDALRARHSVRNAGDDPAVLLLAAPDL